MRRISCLMMFTLLLSNAAAEEYLFSEEPMVRTLIIESEGEIGVLPSEPVPVRNLGNDETITIGEGEPLKLSVVDKNIVIMNEEGTELFRAEALRFEPPTMTTTLLVAGVTFGAGWWWEGKEDRLFEGKMEFRLTDEGKLNAISILPLEEYLRGVVGSEIGSETHLEAQKVQAVAARGETLVALRTGKYAGPHYDICSDVNCQVYSGTRKRSEQSDKAIKATRGLALFHKGEPIGAYYASNCGGHSDNANLVWPDRHPEKVPYWSGIPDDDGELEVDLTDDENFAEWLDSNPKVYCNPAHHPDIPAWTHAGFRWTREFSAGEVTEFVAKHKDIGRVTAIEAGKRGPSGRLTSATFVGENGSFEIGPELAIRRLFTPPLRSAAVVVTTEGGEEGRPGKFIIRGAGYGHGVGLCQVGAMGRAHAGQSFDQILTHYYQESEVKAAYP